MKRFNIIQPALWLLTFLFFSCEDYLDRAPKGVISLIKIKDYEAILNYSPSSRTIGIYNCFFTDDVYYPDSDPAGNLSLDQVSDVIIRNFYTFENQLYPSTSQDYDWVYCYKSISNHNTVLEGIMSTTDGTQAQKESVYAESLLARAFEFSQLLILYAKGYNPTTASTDPGIPLITSSDITQKNLTRSSVQKVHETIIADVLTALPMLPDNPSQNAFRGSKYAARAFLARMYLQQGAYEEALEYAKQVLSTHPDLINLNDCELINPNKTTGRSNVPLRDENPESLYIKYTSFSNGMSGRTYVNPNLIGLFDKNTDRRFYLYITDYYNSKQRDCYMWAQATSPNTGIATPEVYLIAAECQARLGYADLAMNYLEELRKNRYSNYTPIPTNGLTPKDVIKLILDERRRELMMIPGIRLADIKRLAHDADFSQSVVRTMKGETTTVQSTSNKLLVPIPDIVMEYNPDMEQNSRED